MSHTSSTPTGRQQPPLLSRRSGVVRTLGLNIVGPLVVYYLCRNAGIPDVWALVIAGTLPALGVLLEWLRWRRFEVLGAVILGMVAISIGLALVTADAKVVLLQNAVWFGVFGLAFLVSLLWRRPLHFYLLQAFFGGRHSVDGAAMEADYDRNRQARFAWRTANTVWAITCLLVAVGLAVVVQNASTATAMTVSNTAPFVTLTALSAWSYWWFGSAVRSRVPEERRISEQDPLLNAKDNPSQPDASRSQGRRSDA